MDMIKPPVLIGVIIVGAAGFIGYNMMYLPKQQEVAQIEAQIAEEHQTQKAQAEVAALIKEFESYRKRLPPDADPSWFTRQVLDLAEKSGIQLTSITQQPAQLYQGFTHFSLEVTFKTTYHKLGLFLNSIETADAFIRVEHLAMKPAMTPGEPPQIELLLGTVHAPPPVGAPAPLAAGS